MRGPTGATARKPPPRRMTRRGRGDAGLRGRHGAWEQRAKNGGQRDREEEEPLGVGKNSGSRKASGVDPETHGVGGKEGAREASGVEENPRGGRHRAGGGVELSQDDPTRHREGGGVELSKDNSTPNVRVRGVESWQDDSTPNGMGGGVESSHDDSTSRKTEGPRGDETLGALTTSGCQLGEDGRGRGGGVTKNHPPPEQPGSKGQMVATARHDLERRRRTSRRKRQREPAEQGAHLNTSTAQTALRPKTASTRAVSTSMWRQREAKPARSLRQERTAMWPQPTARDGLGRRGGTKNPGV